ncbi:uncharacterized protein BJ171DRAFT_570472 [Polychytrium aggregatum]|uniref:uncharacterized protein n=1 Tax=Polychytrium aggregatum TaxID=110093 RepID=UPI0022FEBF91|nr:uncharacterized protein BJ171DRAFT_570472 [Polychytrium aggregatum]KAI9199477.1 hypothetical protein BJ171DRAFT_570472 [Polychytrium aggregatum]
MASPLLKNSLSLAHGCLRAQTAFRSGIAIKDAGMKQISTAMQSRLYSESTLNQVIQKYTQEPIEPRRVSAAVSASAGLATESGERAPRQMSKSTRESLDLLRNDGRLYAIMEIKGRPYHVTFNDIVVTMKMKDLKPGDVISLDRVREIGGANYVLKGSPYIDPSYFTLTAVVTEHSISKESVETHFLKRGFNKTVRNVNHHTSLRVAQLKIN